jgi:predicted lipoprotein
MSPTNSLRAFTQRIRPWMVWTVVIVVVLALAAANTKVLTTAENDGISKPSFDPAAYALDNYSSKIAPQNEADATDLATLLNALDDGADPAQYGHSSGAASAYSFPVTFTGVIGKLNSPVVPITVDGVPSTITVQLQVGPALNGTAIRDATGTISFNQFTNQLQYQEVGTQLNNQVRTLVISGTDFSTLEGKTITVTGAFLKVNPALVSVVPVKFEVLP